MKEITKSVINKKTGEAREIKFTSLGEGSAMILPSGQVAPLSRKRYELALGREVSTEAYNAYRKEALKIAQKASEGLETIGSVVAVSDRLGAKARTVSVRRQTGDVVQKSTSERMLEKLKIDARAIEKAIAELESSK